MAHVLVPVALDHLHDPAGAIGIARALAGPGGRVTALNVLEAMPAYASRYLPEGHLDRRLEDARTALEAEIGDVSGLDLVVVTGHSARAILDHAASHGVDIIVIASHRKGVQDYLMGSTAARVVRHAPCSVHVLR